MEIRRDDYLEEIKAVMHNGLVKVITGIRRCGKSYFLFTIFRNYLKSIGIDDAQIVSVQLDDDDFEELRSPKALSKYVKDRILTDGRNTYVLIDEIHECNPSNGDGGITFYDVLNSLMKKKGVDIYVTGSNSEMLSEDIATNFRDRGTAIRMWPLSFSEYYGIGGKEKSDAWEDYLVWGGMPLAVLETRQRAREAYLRGLFDEVYFADIVERYNLKDDALLGRICDVMASSIGGLTSPNRLANTIMTEMGIKTNSHTVGDYMECFRKSFLFEKAERWNVKGRKYLGSPVKYYAEDTGLRNARLNFRQMERTHLMENVIYCELCRRGYAVDVGVVDTVAKDGSGKSVRRTYEIDFVINSGFRRVYLQSAFNMSDEGKMNQELRSLRMTGDFFQKIVVTGGNERPWADEDGIFHTGVIPFLLDKSIIEI